MRREGIKIKKILQSPFLGILTIPNPHYNIFH